MLNFGVHPVMLDRSRLLPSEAGQLKKCSRQALRTPGSPRSPWGREASTLGPSSPETMHVLDARKRNPESISYLGNNSRASQDKGAHREQGAAENEKDS